MLLSSSRNPVKQTEAILEEVLRIAVRGQKCHHCSVLSETDQSGVEKEVEKYG